MEMSHDLRDWLETFSVQSVQIWCEDPETCVSSGVISKTYLTYRILMKQVGRDIVGIRHRYSEFESLRMNLKDRYAPLGILIPSLPPKNSVSSLLTTRSADKGFIKERTLGLTMFCEAIVSSPWLKNDYFWKSFMKSGSNSESCDDNFSEIKLVECFSKLEIPYKYTMVQRMEDIKEEITLIDKNVRALLDKVRVVQSCEKSLCAARESVEIQLSAWLDQERSEIKSLAGRAFDENDSILKPFELVTSTLSATASLLKSKFDCQDTKPEYTGLTLATALEQELTMTESFKELFKLHDEFLTTIDTLSTKLGKAEASKAANKQETVADLRRCLEEKQSCLSAFYKGFIYFSLPTSARQRAQSLRRLTAAMASCQITSSFSHQKVCLDYFSVLNMNPASAIAETCRMLELLGVKPLHQLPENFELSAGEITLTDMSFESLFTRAVAIGKGKHASSILSPAYVATVVPDTPNVSFNSVGNPLAVRRASAVVKSRSTVEEISSSKANVDQPTLSEGVDSSNIFNEKAKCLLDGLTGGEVPPSNGRSNVWDEV